MGKEANLRHKSTKLPVQLYRAFLKLSLAGAIYAGFRAYMGLSVAVAVTVALFGAVAYEVTYLIYKSGRKQSKVKNEASTWRQVMLLVKLGVYLVGVVLIITGANLLKAKNYLGIPIALSAIVFCQLLHNNKSVYSHLSTFFENAAVGVAVITLELLFYTLYEKNGSKAWILAIIITVLFYALSEFFFHFFNCKKHTKSEAKKNGKKLLAEILDAYQDKELSEEQFELEMCRQDRRIYCKYLKTPTLILDRMAEFLRNALLVGAIWAIFSMLIVSGSVGIAINAGIFDKAIAIIPIIISVATPAIDSQKNKGKDILDKYDPRISPDEFKKALVSSFGDKCYSAKALKYVCDNMNAKHRLTRYNGEDYYVHPIAVAKIIIDNTREDDDIIAAALLHDCIEDVWNCDKQKILDEYNENIAEIVDLVTKSPDKDYHIPEVMNAYLDKIAENPKAAIIKIADRINNLHTMDNCTDEEKKIKADQTKKYYLPFLDKVISNDVNYEINRHFYNFARKCFSGESEKKEEKKNPA